MRRRRDSRDLWYGLALALAWALALTLPGTAQVQIDKAVQKQQCSRPNRPESCAHGDNDNVDRDEEGRGDLGRARVL